MNKQTAVEWLLENINSEPHSEEDFKYNEKCWDKAKEMEKEQIISANADHCYPTFEIARLDAEEYYNKTFK